MQIFENTGADGAWLPGSTAVSAFSGTLTTATCVSAYKKVGKIVHYRAKVVITTNGTGAGAIQLTLPFAPLADAAFYGKETQGTNVGLTGHCAAAATALFITLATGAYPGADARTLVIAGTYETAA